MRSFDDSMFGVDLRVVAGGRGWSGGPSWGRPAAPTPRFAAMHARAEAQTPRNHPRRPAPALPEVDMTCHVGGLS